MFLFVIYVVSHLSYLGGSLAHFAQFLVIAYFLLINMYILVKEGAKSTNYRVIYPKYRRHTECNEEPTFGPFL